MSLKNSYLRILMLSLNSSKTINELGITVSVGGMLISGIMISKDEFMQANQNSALKAIDDRFETDPKFQEYQNSEDYNALEDTNFLYLKNSFYFFADKKVPSHEGTFIVVHLNDICAYNIGHLGTD